MIAILAAACSSSSSAPSAIGRPAAFIFTQIAGTRSIKFTSTASLGAITVSAWDFGDGTLGSTDLSPTHSYAKSGSYTVQHNVTTSGGPDGITQTLTVNDPEPVRLGIVRIALMTPGGGGVATDTFNVSAPSTLLISVTWAPVEATNVQAYLAINSISSSLTCSTTQCFGAQWSDTSIVQNGSKGATISVPAGTYQLYLRNNSTVNVTGGQGTVDLIPQ